LRFTQRVNDLAALLNDLVVVFLPSRPDSFEHRFESRLTVSLVRGKIGSTDKWF
jgi:hypothetical protein